MGKLHKIKKAWMQLPEDLKIKYSDLWGTLIGARFENNIAIIDASSIKNKWRAYFPFLRALMVETGYRKQYFKKDTKVNKAG